MYDTSRHRRCSVKRLLLEMSQNSQENTCARVCILIKLQASSPQPATLLKKTLWHRCFLVNFATFLRTPVLQNTSGGCFCPHFKMNRREYIRTLYCARALFDKVASLRHSCLPLNFVKFLRTPFFIEHLWWLLLV